MTQSFGRGYSLSAVHDESLRCSCARKVWVTWEMLVDVEMEDLEREKKMRWGRCHRSKEKIVLAAFLQPSPSADTHTVTLSSLCQLSAASSIVRHRRGWVL